MTALYLSKSCHQSVSFIVTYMSILACCHTYKLMSVCVWRCCVVVLARSLEELENSVSACDPSACSDMEGASLPAERPSWEEVMEKLQNHTPTMPVIATTVSHSRIATSVALEDDSTSGVTARPDESVASFEQQMQQLKIDLVSSQSGKLEGYILLPLVVTSPSPQQADFLYYSQDNYEGELNIPNYRRSLEQVLLGIESQCEALGRGFDVFLNASVAEPRERYIMVANRNVKPCLRCIENAEEMQQHIEQGVPELATKGISVRIVDNIGSLHYCEQIKLFHQAVGIISPHGSHAYNTLYNFIARFFFELHPDDKWNGGRYQCRVIEMNGISVYRQITVPRFKFGAGRRIDAESMDKTLQFIRSMLARL